MQLFQDFFDQSKQLNQAPLCTQQTWPYHGQTAKHKIILIGLKIPNLPAPLHYLNFIAQIGQPNVPVLRSEYLISTDALDTASVMCSVSAHMAGQLNSYSVRKDCLFSNSQFQFSAKEQIQGSLSALHFLRSDAELSIDLKVECSALVSCFKKLRMGLAEQWSALSFCSGKIIYKGQAYSIEQQGALEFSRAYNFPYLPLVFYSMQMLNMSGQRQLIFMQTRDALNRILQSRIYLKDLQAGTVSLFDQNVYFKVHRVYPRIQTPNGQKMYLPREFEWQMASEGMHICLRGKSRGDFKFGAGAGYAGSFSYSIQMNGDAESGESGYCEYADCRALNWQEKSQKEKIMDQLAENVPVLLKK